MISSSIRHIKFDKINSTQLWLKENAKILLQKSPKECLIVSCQNQTEGIGRSGHLWEHSEQSLAFSFLALPASEISLTPLEVGVLLAQYLKQKFSVDIELKWPNDLIYQKKKCGGIICHTLSYTLQEQFIVVGVGININEHQHFKERTSLNISTTNSDFQHKIPLDFFKFFNSHRLGPKEILYEWKNRCSHLNKIIKTHQNKQLIEGVFLGIGEKGQGILQTNSDIYEIFCGDIFTVP